MLVSRQRLAPGEISAMRERASYTKFVLGHSPFWVGPIWQQDISILRRKISWRATSALGLTAYESKEMETETVLEGGAFVESIDEFHRLTDNARSMLHQMMEKTVSIVKTGIIDFNLLHEVAMHHSAKDHLTGTFDMDLITMDISAREIMRQENLVSAFIIELLEELKKQSPVLSGAEIQTLSRTSMFSCVYPTRLSVIDNNHLHPTLLSRFDLIYFILDKADGQTYTRQVMKSGAVVMIDTGIYCVDIFDRLSYNARGMLHQMMDRETGSISKDGMQQTSKDHSSGTVDMDLLTMGACASERLRRDNLVSAIHSLIMGQLEIGGRSAFMIELLEELERQTVSRSSLFDFVIPTSSSVIDCNYLPLTLLSRFDLLYFILDKSEGQTYMCQLFGGNASVCSAVGPTAYLAKSNMTKTVQRRSYGTGNSNCKFCTLHILKGYSCLLDPNDPKQTPTYRPLPRHLKDFNCCYYCTDSFQKFEAMVDHQVDEHPFLSCPKIKDPWICPDCGNKFKVKNYAHICHKYN